MTANYFVGTYEPYQMADGSPLASSTTLTDISVAPQFTIGVHCPLLMPGSKMRITAQGKFSTTATPTLLIGLYYGGVAGSALAATAALTTISGAANTTWRAQWFLTCRTIGTSGTILTMGSVYGVTAVTAVAQAPASAPAAVTVDTTTGKALTIGAQWGTSSASNTITLMDTFFELLN
jgi:hypothetical protein